MFNYIHEKIKNTLEFRLTGEETFFPEKLVRMKTTLAVISLERGVWSCILTGNQFSFNRLGFNYSEDNFYYKTLGQINLKIINAMRNKNVPFFFYQ